MNPSLNLAMRDIDWIRHTNNNMCKIWIYVGLFGAVVLIPVLKAGWKPTLITANMTELITESLFDWWYSIRHQQILTCSKVGLILNCKFEKKPSRICLVRCRRKTERNLCVYFFRNLFCIGKTGINVFSGFLSELVGGVNILGKQKWEGLIMKFWGQTVYFCSG